MSHHSDDAADALLKKFVDQGRNAQKAVDDELAALCRPGPTGQFPNGKLSEKDQGQIVIGLASIDGRVVMNLGKPVARYARLFNARATCPGVAPR